MGRPMAIDGYLSERFEALHDRISRACTRVSRPAGTVTLIAITKTQPIETLQALIDFGVTNLGENRVSEIIEKTPQLRGNYTMHLIGHLQTNKVSRVLPHVHMIQSIDRIRVIDYIERYLPPDVRMPVLVEVNTSGEASKEGCAPRECRMVIERLLGGGRLTAEGYMTIGPLGGNEKKTRAAFSLLRDLAEKNRDLVPQPQLSMGMSGDFEWAIEEGATMVRIGTLLTGERA
ncbi:MAG: YggS family pyridoxal phosphate-dependent enzyme [Chitinispirillaceae bacterium]|nr:YggS family pyridoxal phosphate-dependent enzyme [Chitinispirillaceae bacterium]